MKRLLLAVILLSSACFAVADINTATSLAQQAGAIAGAASACGQDISPLSSRIQQAFSVMLTDENERAKATALYLQAYNNAREMEQTKAKIPCDQVLKDYNNLPILKADYQQMVLPSLRDNPPAVTAPAAPAPITPAPQAAAPVPSIPAPTPGIPSAPAMPPQNVITPPAPAVPAITPNLPVQTAPAAASTPTVAP